MKRLFSWLFSRAATGGATGRPSPRDSGPDPVSDPNLVVVELTPAAARELVKRMADLGKVSLRFSVVAEESGAFRYGMEFDENAPRRDDFAYSTQGVDVVVDSQSARYLIGTTVDWIERDDQAGFFFDNPNAIQVDG